MGRGRVIWSGATGLLALSMVGSSALAQTVPAWQASQWQPWQPPITWTPYVTPQFQQARPLDQGFEDVGPAGTSLRQVEIDPRAPLDFEQVYRTSTGDLMRQQGGIRAIFPRSAYIAGNDGSIPEVPAGTIFRIGPDDPFARAVQGEQPGVGVHDQRRVQAVRIDDILEDAGAAGERELPSATVFTSESYRRARLATLLERAASQSR